MDKCVKLAVVLVMSSHIASGRSYASRADSHEHFQHPYQGHQSNPWLFKDPDWDQYMPSRGHQRPVHYQKENKEFYPHKHTHYDKDSSKTHHSEEWNSGSWEYPDFPGHGSPNSWGHHGWGDHGTPNHWPQRPSGPSHPPHKPTWNNANPSPWGPITPPSTTSASTSRSSTGNGSKDALAILLCIKSCPVTSEYNPVCGSNNVTYGNPGRLECAKYCGVDVTLRRNSICPTPGLNNTAAQNATNSRPNVQQTVKPIAPTRFTTVEIPSTEPTNRPASSGSNPPITISPDIINSIFTSTTTTEDDNWDIDIRTRSRLPSQYVYPV